MRCLLFYLALVATSASLPSDAAHFISIGDWGCNRYSGYDTPGTKAFMSQAAKVKTAVKEYVSNHSISETLDGFRPILSAGDNFYRCGVNDEKDPQWKTWHDDFGSVAEENHLWLSVLGNHDYATNPDAQVERMKSDANWFMPGRNWYRRLLFPDVNISVVGLDGNPCCKMYRSSSPKKWDPKKCQAGYKSIFHKNIMLASCQTQVDYLRQVTQEMDQQHPEDVRILLVHEPLSDMDVAPELWSAIKDARFKVSLTGHRHEFAIYKFDQAGHNITNIINGAGCHDNYAAADENEEMSTASAGLNKTESSLNKQKGFKYVWRHTPRGGFCSHEVTKSYMKTRFREADGRVVKELNLMF